MSTTEQRPALRKICDGCAEPFDDTSKNRARSFCLTCRPPTTKGGVRIAPPVPKSRVTGEPFTVGHFTRWSRRFKMKDNRYFKIDPYQTRFLEDLFARDKQGKVVYSECWLVVPEGNGKTTFTSLIVLYWIEFKPEAWVPVAASARDQAVDLTYRIAAGFVTRNGQSDRYKLHPGYRSIIHKGSLGACKIFASDAASGDGVDPDLAIIEELHRLATMELYETWAGKLDKSDGQLIVVSTAGEVGGAFEKLRTHIRQSATDVQREGCFTRAAHGGVVLHEYALPEGGDPEDLALIAEANPFTRKTQKSLERKRAKPSWNLAHWLRFTCNRPTRVANAAITEKEWHDGATAEAYPLDVETWVGIDVGWRWDTTALVPLAWVSDEHRRFGPATIIVPPRDTSSTDPALFKFEFMQLMDTYRVTTVVMDMNRAEDIAGWLSDELGLEVIDRVQTNLPQSEDYERFMLALRAGYIRHSGDAGFRQHALNAVTKVLPDGSAKFTRVSEVRATGNQEVRVIDALVAAAMVHSVRAAPPEPEPDYAVAGF